VIRPHTGLYVSDGGIGRRYQLWGGIKDKRRLLLDLWIADTGAKQDLTRPPYEWEH